MPELLTTAEAAKLLRISPHTLALRRMTGKNCPPYIRNGGRILYSPEAISEWLAENTFRSTTEASERDLTPAA